MLVDCETCKLVDKCDQEDRWYGCINYKPRPHTNADRIRAMSDEELAELIFDCVACDDCPVGSKKCKREFVKCKDAALCWLKQEADHA